MLNEQNKQLAGKVTFKSYWHTNTKTLLLILSRLSRLHEIRPGESAVVIGAIDCEDITAVERESLIDLYTVLEKASTNTHAIVGMTNPIDKSHIEFLHDKQELKALMNTKFAVKKASECSTQKSS